MLLHIWHDSSCKKRFDVFFEGKKLKSGEEYPLPQKSCACNSLSATL